MKQNKRQETKAICIFKHFIYKNFYTTNPAAVILNAINTNSFVCWSRDRV